MLLLYFLHCMFGEKNKNENKLVQQNLVFTSYLPHELYHNISNLGNTVFNKINVYNVLLSVT